MIFESSIAIARVLVKLPTISPDKYLNFGHDWVKPGEKKGSIAGLVEKPAFGKEPSNLASIGRYVLTPNIFSILKSQKKEL